MKVQGLGFRVEGFRVLAAQGLDNQNGAPGY